MCLNTVLLFGVTSYLILTKSCRSVSPMYIFDCFNIVKKCISYNDLVSTEALFIKKLQPNLNNQLSPDKGSRVSINIFK